MTKDAIAGRVQELVKNKYPATEYGLCFYYALMGYKVLKEEGFDPLIQAGSMCWPIVKPENDDGVKPTHFSFVWSPNKLPSKLSMACGKLPEVHVWLALRPDVLIDFSTFTFKGLCTKITGLEWETEPPPQYLWSSKLPEGVCYIPDAIAIEYCIHSLLTEGIPDGAMSFCLDHLMEGG